MIALSHREQKALREAQELHRRHDSMGRRKIVSMQGCEREGLVQRVAPAGYIIDWTLTPAGLAWPDQEERTP